MQRFFQRIDAVVEQDPVKLTNAFADYYWRTEKTMGKEQENLNSDDKIELPPTVSNLQNISILAQNTSLEFLTKRVPLIADTSIFAHFGEQAHVFFEPYNRDNTFRVKIDHERATIGCPSLRKLGIWLKECKPLLLRGDLFYLPDIRYEKVFFSGYSGRLDESITKTSSKNLLLDALVNNKKLVEKVNQNNDIPQIISSKTKTLLLKPILTIDLPYIEDVDLSTFVKITSDENESFQRFKDFLRLKFLEIKHSESSEFFDSELAKMAIELRDGVRHLNYDFNRLQKKTAFSIIGASVAAVTAVLVAVNSAAFGILPEILGGGGGILGLNKVIGEYLNEKDKIETSPYFYLWLFSNKVHRRV